MSATHAHYGKVMDQHLRAARVSRRLAAVEMRVNPTALQRKLTGRAPIYVPDLATVAELTGTSVVELNAEAEELAQTDAGRVVDALGFRW